MHAGAPKEIEISEYRVALVPSTVADALKLLYPAAMM
jgi:alanine dehydrogenase